MLESLPDLPCEGAIVHGPRIKTADSLVVRWIRPANIAAKLRPRANAKRSTSVSAAM